NAVAGRPLRDEELRRADGVEYRAWDPFRSKLAAYLLHGAPPALWNGSRSVLYLGGAHGTTVSHLAEALPDATVYAVEKSPTSFAPLLRLSRERPNIVPILADAQLPERYAADVGRVDFLYQGVAQRQQATIFVENVRACLARSGRGVLMLKVRSVTQRQSPTTILRSARSTLDRRRAR
ncbi:Fibrillarin, partial [mine drainage metagenome]